MKLNDLNILVQEGEGTTLEFKENLSPSISRELVALANTIGGKILLGVSDNGKVVGVQDSNTLRARVQDIARNCDPPVKIREEVVDRVLVVHVRESESKPVQCSDGFFWRQGAVTQKLSRDEIRDFFRFEGVIRFDLTPCPRFKYPEDFDQEKFDTWLGLSGISGQPKVEDVLVNIDAAERVESGLLFRNAGVLFFAKNVRRFFPQAYITCLLAKGTDKVDILDRKDFDGGVIADIEDALRFIARNTRTAYRINGLIRENIPEYPTEALREAITNSVMHRDWFIDGANVFVEIYTDRVEVVSPGGLPRGLALADLGSKSIRRNALIADLLHRISFIEKAGTGIRRIQNETRAQGCPEPEFDANGFFTATFWPNPAVREQVEGKPIEQVTMEENTEENTEETEYTEENTEENTEETEYTEENTEETNEKPRRATKSVQLLQAISGEMARKDIQIALGLKSDEHFRKTYLLPAIQAGLIEMTIPDNPNNRNQRYRLTRKGHEVLKNNRET